MTVERQRDGLPVGDGSTTPWPTEAQATHVPPQGHGGGSNAALDTQRPPEAAHPPPEIPCVPQAIQIEIVDVAKFEAEKRERELARMRAYTRRRYHETKQAALAGDEDAQERWQRMQEANRRGQRRWRETHREQHLAYQRDYKRRKKLKWEPPPGSRTASADPGK
jgi:hypothetical protein